MDVIGDIEQQIGKAREALDNKRTELVEQQMKIIDQITELDRQIAALDAMVQAKSRSQSPRQPRTQRTNGVHRTRSGNGDMSGKVLDVISRAETGMRRADIINAMGAHGDARTSASISSALVALKKTQRIKHEDGFYSLPMPN